MPDLEIAKLEIGKLELKPGDTLVIRGFFSDSQMAAMVKYFEPQVAILFITPSTELTVLTPAQKANIRRQLGEG